MDGKGPGFGVSTFHMLTPPPGNTVVPKGLERVGTIQLTGKPPQTMSYPQEVLTENCTEC